MKKLLSALAATILAAAFALPLNAAPMFVPKPEQVRANVVEKVKHRKYYRHWRGDRRWHRRQAWRSCRYYGNCYYPRRYYGKPQLLPAVLPRLLPALLSALLSGLLPALGASGPDQISR